MADPDPLLLHVMREQVAALERLAARLVRDRHEAEDLVQEVFLRLLERPPAGPMTEGAWFGYLHRCVHNRAISEVRERKERRPSLLSGEDADLQPPAEDRPAQTRLVLAEELVELRSQLTRLPALQRRAILLVDLEQHTHEEATRLLAVDLCTLRSALARGRRSLRERCQAWERRMDHARPLAPRISRGQSGRPVRPHARGRWPSRT